MNRKLLVYRIVLCTLALCLMTFIFWQSSKTGETSGTQSEEIVGDVIDVVAPSLGSDNTVEGWKLKGALHYAFRKVAHVAEFALLSFLVSLFVSTYEMQKWQIALLSVGFTVLYAASDELHQSFIPGRYASWKDMGYDSLGAVLGWVCALAAIWLFYRVIKKRRQKVD